MINKTNIKYINFLTSSSLGNIRSGFLAFLNSIRRSSNFISYVDDLKSRNKVKPGIYERKQLTVNLEANVKNKNLKEVLKQKLNLDFAEYEKIKNYAIQSTLRNINSTANFNLDNNYIYVYAPNYFSSLSEEQINGQNYEYLIGIKHLVGDPIFAPKILVREMYLIEKDYRETLSKEIEKNRKIIYIDYSQEAKSTSWFLDYSHFTEFAANKLSSKLAEDILEVMER
ncbi:hypothetical protein B0W81_03370 [Prochlorococcus sp. HOT_208_60]|nr:hypothetical protein B0W81_03370 [Prochlorococcus sp. HOT_208_60]